MQGSTSRSWVTRAPRALAALACATLLASAPASAARAGFHLHLLRSDPAADATLATAPTALRLTFSERPELAVTTVRLTGQANARLPLARLTRVAHDPATVVAAVRGPLAAGEYTVAWRTMSHDGHPMHGTYHFHVGAHAHGH